MEINKRKQLNELKQPPVGGRIRTEETKQGLLFLIMSLKVPSDFLNYVTYDLDKINNIYFTETKQRGSKFLKLKEMYLQRDFHDVCEYKHSVLSVEILWLLHMRSNRF